MGLHSFSDQQGFAGLTLVDGSSWGIIAGDKMALAIVSRFAETMQLHPCQEPTYRLIVVTDGDDKYADTTHHDQRSPFVAFVPWMFLPTDNNSRVTCILSPTRNNDILINQFIQLSLFIVQQTQILGGLLLHGALIERNGWGIILAGPGRVGKTTASRRLPSSWRSLSDDATLIVCDEEGAYWAHPWPTWSYFMSGGRGGTWDVNHAVPLKAIFFLQKAQLDRAEPVAPGQSVCLLVELAEHTSWSMAHGKGKEVARTLRLQRFENICALVKDVPCYHLHLSLDGSFWKEIEEVIIEGNKDAL
jgi:SynChlorMet cassette protein ScmC